MSRPPLPAPMRRNSLVLGLALVVAAGALVLAVRWVASPLDLGSRSHPGGRSPQRPATSPTAATPATHAGGGGAPIDPSLPQYIGLTRRIAAQAIDDTAAAPMNEALIALARRFQGTPFGAFPMDQQTPERLLLDLEHVDQLRFVEQMLALVNSRQVKTRTEAADRFSDHVRNLRYHKGQVSYCGRHHYVSLWAQAAERQGYLVNLTPFLLGATSRRRPLTFLSSHPGAYPAMRLPANRTCITTLERTLAVDQSYVPLRSLAPVLPSLRSGDVFALVTQQGGLDVSAIGVVEVEGNQIHALQAAPGSGVELHTDMARWAWGRQGVIGLSFYRPVPNSDGRADR